MTEQWNDQENLSEEDARTAEATEEIVSILRAQGYYPSGVAESGNVHASYNFVVAIHGEDYDVEVTKLLTENS